MIYLDLFLTFLRIGAFTFGGGYAMLPLIREQILAKGWLSEPEIVNFIAISESTPGPFAINISTYIGSQTAGFLGAICATLGVIVTSFVIIIVIAKFYEKFKTNKTVSACMSGLKPAVIGLIAAAILSVSKAVFFESGISVSVFHNLKFYISLLILITMTILAFKKIHPVIIILLSAIIGITAGYLIL